MNPILLDIGGLILVAIGILILFQLNFKLYPIAFFLLLCGIIVTLLAVVYT